jgi:hypothetical protein
LVGENTSKNIPNGKMNEKRHIQALPALSTLTAILLRDGRETRRAVSAKGRHENLSFARAEAQIRMGRWNA